MRFVETKPEASGEEDPGPRLFVVSLPTYPLTDEEPEPCAGPCCVRPDDNGLF